MRSRVPEGPAATASHRKQQLAGVKITTFSNTQDMDPSYLAEPLSSRFSLGRYLVFFVSRKRGGAGEKVEISVSLSRPLTSLLSSQGFWEPQATILFLGHNLGRQRCPRSGIFEEQVAPLMYHPAAAFIQSPLYRPSVPLG